MGLVYKLEKWRREVVCVRGEIVEVRGKFEERWWER